MNYLHRHHTHATPKPKPTLSGVYITNNPRLNEVRLNRLIGNTTAQRIHKYGSRYWRKNRTKILDILSVSFVVSVLALFAVAYLIWA